MAKEATYTHFIPQNIAPAGAKRIGVYDSNGKRVGGAGLQGLALPTSQEKQYSFLCISDSHVYGTDNTIDETVDFVRALKYAQADPDIEFIATCGDVLDTYNSWLLTDRYTALRNANTTKPVYAITGNHESSGLTRSLTDNDTLPGFGFPLFYSITRGNDVFIMLCEAAWKQASLFADGELQFLYDTLEANRDKRCFVFFHVLSFDEGDSGRPNTAFYSDGDLFALDANKAQKTCFIDLLKHYPNVIWFHGHSHALFQLQEISPTNTYSTARGYKSVHIPSLAKPKDWNGSSTVTVNAESQGYVIDVYPDGIHLRGRDFVKGEFLPIASYWINTSFTPVAAKTHKDTSGLIVT